MKICSVISLSLLTSIVPICAFGQSSSQTVDYNRSDLTVDQYGPHGGEFELMLGGNGTANKRLDGSLGAIDLSLGYNFTATQEILVRQSSAYNKPQGGAKSWNGATRVAFDQFIVPRGAFRPFVGANFGGVYGDHVDDTWAAGLEAGAKFYVQPRTFIEARAEYAWYFRHSRNFDNSFDSGQWNWGLGVGFNF